MLATFLFFSLHCVEKDTSSFRIIKKNFLDFFLSGRKTIGHRTILVLKFKTFIYQHVIGVMRKKSDQSERKKETNKQTKKERFGNSHPSAQTTEDKST